MSGDSPAPPPDRPLPMGSLQGTPAVATQGLLLAPTDDDAGAPGSRG